jgi:hypothetical protein
MFPPTPNPIQKIAMVITAKLGENPAVIPNKATSNRY